MTGMDASHIHQIEAEDAWNILAIDHGAALVDVRREAEVEEEGQPDLDELNRTVWHIEWRCDRLPSIKAHFVVQIEEALDAKSATHLIFYCNDGRRALSAASIVAGAFEKAERKIDISCIVAVADKMGDCWKTACLPWRHP
ncbi:MAG: hypothetical protein AAF557_00700 [Pseudomonadota bacterium]